MDIAHNVQYQFNLSLNQEELNALHDLINVKDLPEAFKTTHNSISNSIDTYKRAMDASLMTFQQELIGAAGMSATINTHQEEAMGTDDLKSLIGAGKTEKK